MKRFLSGDEAFAEGVRLARPQVISAYPITPQTVVVEQEDGSRNEIVVTSEGAYMAFSSCDNQLCVHMGEVTLDNWETRPNQAFIICLPNRVSVELIPVQ